MIATNGLALMAVIVGQGRRGVMSGLMQVIPTRCFGQAG
jgi:hypothetical protein